MIDLRDRPRFLRELLVAELLAKPGQGPLARPVWPRPALPVPPPPPAAEPKR